MKQSRRDKRLAEKDAILFPPPVNFLRRRPNSYRAATARMLFGNRMNVHQGLSRIFPGFPKSCILFTRERGEQTKPPSGFGGGQMMGKGAASPQGPAA